MTTCKSRERRLLSRLFPTMLHDRSRYASLRQPLSKAIKTATFSKLIQIHSFVCSTYSLYLFSLVIRSSFVIQTTPALSFANRLMLSPEQSSLCTRDEYLGVQRNFYRAVKSRDHEKAIKSATLVFVRVFPSIVRRIIEQHRSRSRKS